MMSHFYYIFTKNWSPHNDKVVYITYMMKAYIVWSSNGEGTYYVEKTIGRFFMYQQLVILMRTLEMESFLEFHLHFWKTWCFIHKSIVAYGLCQMVLVFHYMKKNVYVVTVPNLCWDGKINYQQVHHQPSSHWNTFL